jgi:hypothetical protein
VPNHPGKINHSKKKKKGKEIMKNTIKRAIIFTLIIATLMTPFYPATAKTVTQRTTVKTYHSMKVVPRMNKGKFKVSIFWKNHKYNEYTFTRKPKIKFISINRLSYEQLVSRKKTNTLYIELSTGRQLNKRGDGKILNAPDPHYNYIRYHGFHKDDIIRTYCIYNPYNNWEDDIIDRFDEKIR